MGDKILRALHDPSEIAHAQLLPIPQRARDRQTRRITERLSSGGNTLGRIKIYPRSPKLLSAWEIQTEQITTIIRHTNILTPIEALPPASYLR
jgi:hypothetical protein